MTDYSERVYRGQRAVQQAASEFVDDGELVVSWGLVMEVVGPGGEHYLATRCGGGHDGTDPAPVWTRLGMHQAAVSDAAQFMAGQRANPDDD